MQISEKLLKLIEFRYLELKRLGETDGILDEKHLGEIRLFINKKPQLVLLSFSFDEDKIYLGS